jgi:hypothetical protein
MLQRICAILRITPYNQKIADPGDAGAICVNLAGSCNLTSVTGNETRTLAAPAYLGQIVSLNYAVDGGTQITVTSATVINVANNTTMLFEVVGDFITLIAGMEGTTLMWRVLSNPESLTLG